MNIYSNLIFILLFTSSLLFLTATSHAGVGHHAHEHKISVGEPAKGGEVTKTITVTMLDSMKYVFDQPLDLYEGDVVRFIVTNKGVIPHEFSIGDSEEQKKHAEMMRNNPGMSHEDGNAVSLDAGETGELIWRFKAGEKVVFACNIPGHFEAGMHEMAAVFPLSRGKILSESEMNEKHDHSTHEH